MDDCGRLGIAGRQQFIEALLVDRLARLVAEWILAKLAKRLTPLFDELAKGPLAGAVADETFAVLDLPYKG
jgi:hypothetical protein